MIIVYSCLDNGKQISDRFGLFYHYKNSITLLALLGALDTCNEQIALCLVLLKGPSIWGIVTHSGLVLELLKSFWKRRASSSKMVTPLALESAPYDSHCVTHK